MTRIRSVWFGNVFHSAARLPFHHQNILNNNNVTLQAVSVEDQSREIDGVLTVFRSQNWKIAKHKVLDLSFYIYTEEGLGHMMLVICSAG